MKSFTTTAAILLAKASLAAAECDLMCIAIYSMDPVKCECVPIKFMECHP